VQAPWIAAGVEKLISQGNRNWPAQCTELLN